MDEQYGKYHLAYDKRKNKQVSIGCDPIRHYAISRYEDEEGKYPCNEYCSDLDYSHLHFLNKYIATIMMAMKPIT
jgi:hypothetical protein